MTRKNGCVRFVSRAADAIRTSGHLIGACEVERIFIEHKAVTEALVIGKPDSVVMKLLKPFVSWEDGDEPNDTSKRRVLGVAHPASAQEWLRRRSPVCRPCEDEKQQDHATALEGARAL